MSTDYSEDQTAGSGRVVKADSFFDWQQAQDIVAAAEEKAEEILEASHEAYEQAKHRGYEDGVREAERRCQRQMLETADGCIEYVKNCEAAISRLAVNAIEKIIGSCDHERVTQQLIRQGLERMAAGDDLRIRVPGGKVGEYQKILAEQPERLQSARLIECDSLAPGECLLESSLGLIRVSLREQVEELKNSIQQVFPE